MQPNFFDYSQYSTWFKCPWKWYERYVARRQKRWPAGPRSDALCIGSLVHAGLQIWQQSHRVEIPRDLISELRPTPETLTICQLMVHGYTHAYPAERWPLVRCEQPLRFPLVPREEGCKCRNEEEAYWFCQTNFPYDCPSGRPGIDGLAKIDAYFQVPEQTTIESGIPGYECSLSPGWWVHEYKTKADSIDISRFIQRWAVNKQADFQSLALAHHTGEPVQGILINVIEKPRVYIPKRKCQSCSKLWELPAWLPASDGNSRCPECHTEQRLGRGNTSPTISNPSYYRFAVQRTPQQLETSHRQFQQIALAMQQVRASGMHSVSPNTENCVDTRWGACEYFDNHTYDTDTADDPGMQDVPDYVGEPLITLT